MTRRVRQDGIPTPFLDMAWTICVCFIALVLIMADAKPKADTGKIIPKAEFMIQLDWPDGSTADIDLYVRGPDGVVVYFNRRETALMFLDRDQLGSINNTVVMPNGEHRAVNDRREIVTIRAVMPGEWLANAHYYSQRSGEEVPVPVRLTITKLNPYSIVTVAEAVLEGRGAEVTLANFVLDESGRVTSVYVVPVNLVGKQ